MPTYFPPSLPPHLAGSFELNPVEGVPSDEEVKAIHAVIRALEGMSHREYTRNVPGGIDRV
jgi:hypothetical protein